MKDIPGYEGLYAASSDGRIWSYRRHSYLSGHIDKLGYVTVSLYRGSAKNTRKVHRLIALAHIPQIADKPHINHKDGDKTNNNVSNLEWVDRKENASHAIKLGLYKDTSGERNGASKLSASDVVEIRQLRKEGLSLAVIAKRFNITDKNVSHIALGKGWPHLPL